MFFVNSPSRGSMPRFSRSPCLVFFTEAGSILQASPGIPANSIVGGGSAGMFLSIFRVLIGIRFQIL